MSGPTVRLLNFPDAEIELRDWGSDGAPLIMIPSLGRASTDFDGVARLLVDAGHRPVGVNPRGIGGSKGPLDGITLHDLAGDVAEVIDALRRGPLPVLGHAFGNRIARCVSADHPRLVRAVILLGAGGLVPPLETARASFRRIMEPDVPADEHLAAVAAANFAANSDASAWATGWWRDTAWLHAAAAGNTPREEWWTAGEVPLLVVQGLEDRMAPPGNGRELAQALGSRVTLVELEDAAHALLPEQPARIAAAVSDWLHAQAGDRVSDAE